eukprot:jgi/Ulvmu1/10314/UM060_0116.1
MSVLGKASAFMAALGIGGYGLYCAANLSTSRSELVQHQSALSSIKKDLNVWEAQQGKTAKALESAEAKAKAQEEEVVELRAALKAKEEEADALRGRLSEASKSLAASLDSLAATRKASADLRAKIISGSARAKKEEDAAREARQEFDKVATRLNPLAHPDVRKLFGG